MLAVAPEMLQACLAATTRLQRSSIPFMKFHTDAWKVSVGAWDRGALVAAGYSDCPSIGFLLISFSMASFAALHLLIRIRRAWVPSLIVYGFFLYQTPIIGGICSSILRARSPNHL